MVRKMIKSAGSVTLFGFFEPTYGGRHFGLRRGTRPSSKFVRIPRDPRFKGRHVRVTISIVEV